MQEAAIEFLEATRNESEVVYWNIFVFEPSFFAYFADFCYSPSVFYKDPSIM